MMEQKRQTSRFLHHAVFATEVPDHCAIIVNFAITGSMYFLQKKQPPVTLSATHINYFHICQRKLWLFANGINMEHTSETVADGKLLHETSYPQRAEKYSEIELSASLKNGILLTGKVDFYDAKNKLIHETKRSDKAEDAHEWQVKFYSLLLLLNGIEGATGKLEYPKLRETKQVALTATDIEYLQENVITIEQLITSEQCPPRINSKICKSCSYFDFCYVEEDT